MSPYKTHQDYKSYKTYCQPTTSQTSLESITTKTPNVNRNSVVNSFHCYILCAVIKDYALYYSEGKKHSKVKLFFLKNYVRSHHDQYKSMTNTAKNCSNVYIRVMFKAVPTYIGTIDNLYIQKCVDSLLRNHRSNYVQ